MAVPKKNDPIEITDRLDSFTIRVRGRPYYFPNDESRISLRTMLLHMGYINVKFTEDYE